MRWQISVFSMELRKLLTYRFDFWVGFLGTTLTHLAVAFFLWKAVFASLGTSTLGGFSFKGIMLYHLLVPIIDKLVRGDEIGYMSADIYDGQLNRYLVYPLSFYRYKYVSHTVFACVASCQIIFALFFFSFVFGMPAEFHITLPHLGMGLMAAFFANYLFFAMGSILEMVAFWADNVWSLQVMLRFTISFLGGAFIPLSIFPAAAQRLLEWLPFSFLVSFPIRTLLGQVPPQKYILGLCISGAWSLLFTGISHQVWKRGIRQYSGVGI